jgi:hypothetical protein
VQQTLLQNARKWDLQVHVLSGENHLQHFLVYRRSRSKHEVLSEGLMMLSEDKRPETNRLIEV